jgi:hypothetical protein
MPKIKIVIVEKKYVEKYIRWRKIINRKKKRTLSLKILNICKI